jgi:hypothetical protein
MRELNWRAGKLSYKMHPKQLVIYESMRALPRTTRWRVAECARGFGKSWLGVMMALEDAIRPPHTYPVYILGPELKQTRRIIEPIMRVVTADAPEGFIRHIRSEDIWEIAGCNRIILGGFNRDSFDKWRGQRAKAFYLEEARDIDKESYSEGVLEAISPMLLHSWGGVIMLTTVPKDLDHPYETHTVPLAKRDGSYHKFTIDDNPTLTPSQREQAARDMGGVDTPGYRREYLCERVRDESSVCVPEYDDKRDGRILNIPESVGTITVVDWGGVQDLTVAGVMYYDFLNDWDCVFDERVFPKNTDTATIVTALREMEQGLPVLRRVVDAPGQLLVDLHQQHAYTATLPQKDDWQAAINAVRVRAGQGKLKVHLRCTQTRATLEHGSFNERRTDFSRTEALGHMDALAMVMYGIRSLDRQYNPYARDGDRSAHFIDRRSANSGLQSFAKVISPLHRKKL